MKKPILRQTELIEDIYEMLLHNWEQLAITGDPSWMVKNEKHRKRKINPIRLKENFFKLHDQNASLSPDGSEYVEKYREIVSQLMDARVQVANGDRSAMNFVNMFEGMLENLTKGDGNFDIIKSRMMVQKAYGLAINPKEITVPEYRKIVEVVEEISSAQPNINNDGEN